MLELEDDLSSLASRFVYKNKIYKTNQLPEETRYNNQDVFPLLSNSMNKLLGIQNIANLKDNVYKKQQKKIQAFAEQWLTHPQLQQKIFIDITEWLKVPADKIFQVSYYSNNLLLGYPSPMTVISPKGTLGKHGPFRLPPKNNVTFFAVFQEDDRDIANELFKAMNNYTEKKEEKWIYGNNKSLYDFIRLRFQPDSSLSLRFSSLEKLSEEIKCHLDKTKFDHENKRYVAIYLSPVSAGDSSEEKSNVYYEMKELLLKYNISLQVINRDKIGNGDFRKYYIHNLAPAMLAKAGGIPWQLERVNPKELIVGVGAYINLVKGVQYIGSAFSFDSSGTMRQFNCISKSELFMLEGDIREFIYKHIKEFGQPERLVIHYYKTMSEHDMLPITKMLHELKMDDLPVYIISISKTLQEDYILFDQSYAELLPLSGTIAQISRNQYLLFNNTRYGKNYDKIESYYYPIRLRISCTKPKLLEDYLNVKKLIDQVYQFSRVYYKSVKQQNLPVTISYPTMLAKIYSHFKDEHLNDFARTNLWFL